MKQYLFGEISVNITAIRADSEEIAEGLFASFKAGIATQKEKDDFFETAAFYNIWREFPGDNPIVQRDQVLATFLNLLQSRIPFTPDALPSSIIVPPGSIAIREQTKIVDQESCQCQKDGLTFHRDGCPLHKK